MRVLRSLAECANAWRPVAVDGRLARACFSWEPTGEKRHTTCSSSATADRGKAFSTAEAVLATPIRAIRSGARVPDKEQDRSRLAQLSGSPAQEGL
jgi:hypothetical protein